MFTPLASAQAFITCGSFTAIHAILETPFEINFSELFINPGKCLAEQVGVKAPGRANKTTVEDSKYSSMLICLIPSSSLLTKTPEGKVSPIFTDIQNSSKNSLLN